MIIIVNIMNRRLREKMFQLHRNNDNLNVQAESLKAIYRRNLFTSALAITDSGITTSKESGSPIIIIFLVAVPPLFA